MLMLNAKLHFLTLANQLPFCKSALATPQSCQNQARAITLLNAGCCKQPVQLSAMHTLLCLATSLLCFIAVTKSIFCPTYILESTVKLQQAFCMLSFLSQAVHICRRNGWRLLRHQHWLHYALWYGWLALCLPPHGSCQPAHKRPCILHCYRPPPISQSEPCPPNLVSLVFMLLSEYGKLWYQVLRYQLPILQSASPLSTGHALPVSKLKF